VLPARRTALAETKLVIFKRRPLPEELAAAQAANTCGSAGSAGDSMSSTGAAASGTRPIGGAEQGGELKVPRSSRSKRSKTALGVLGVRFTRAAEVVKDVPAVLYVLLGIAIGLLAAAAMPLRLVPNARMAAVLAYQRAFVALAGAVTLASVAVVYALAY
jgi:hypothetical protein